MFNLINHREWPLTIAALVFFVSIPFQRSVAQVAAGPTTQASQDQISPAVAKELETLRKRIEQLEEQLQYSKEQPANRVEVVPPTGGDAAGVRPPANAPTEALVSSPLGAPEKAKPAEPFAFADWTWLNGNARTKTPAFDSPFFTPEIRADVDYIYDFRHPKDDTISGSSEVFRSSEVQLTQLGVGGDFHFDNVRAHLMTQFGMYSQTTLRNDSSPSRGQWNLADAYRYVSEAYGGYHFNVLHGINVDAGIFMSYVGLASYYNFDNWMYQPSYVSSNTPWFFNGVRVQIFPTAHLKIEPWFVNGWQAYGRFNQRPGIGGQILWRPNGWLSILGNQYALGPPALGNPGRIRYHTDDSIEIKYYDHPGNWLDKAAFSLTGDAGCEHGGGVSCWATRRKVPSRVFWATWFITGCGSTKICTGSLLAGGRSTILYGISCFCHPSTARTPPRAHPTSRKIPGTLTRPGMHLQPSITCPANTSLSAGNMTTAPPMFHILRARAGLRLRSQHGHAGVVGGRLGPGSTKDGKSSEFRSAGQVLRVRLETPAREYRRWQPASGETLSGSSGSLHLYVIHK